MISWLSQLSGLGENVLRLLVSILAAYPIAIVYKTRLLGPIASLTDLEALKARNNYLVVAGLGVSLFYNRWNIIHSLLTVAGTYTICQAGNLFGSRFMAACLVFVFNLAYLISGYIVNSGTDYDLTWTMPQCVLCLRMIGFGLDFYDGEREACKDTQSGLEKNSLTKDAPSKKSEQPVKAPGAKKSKTPISFGSDTALAELPSFLHFVGYAYFFSAFLVGPQFSFSLYRKFIEGKSLTLDKSGNLPQGAFKAALRCFFKGVLYLALQMVLDGYFPTSALFKSEFRQLPFFHRVVVIWFTGRTLVNKYLGIWAINEGSCILSGISFSGYDAQGHAEWDGLTNIDTYSFETATSLNQIIGCFNINTNLWVKQYIFKRLRFLNSKELSQLGSLFFLALWHGFHSGYFACFLLEFVDIWVEQRLVKLISPRTQWIHATHPSLSYLINLLCYLYTFGALHYALIAFGLLHFKLYYEAYSSIYFLGHGVPFAMAVMTFLLSRPSGHAISSAKAVKKSQ